MIRQQGAAWAECTCAGARISTSLSFSAARVSLILPPSSSAMRRSAPRCNAGPREAGALSLIFTFHSVRSAEQFHRIYAHAVRLGAVLPGPHVAVESLRTRGVCANVCQAGRVSGPLYFLIHDAPLAGLPRRPRTSCFVPGEFLGPGNTERCFLCVMR